MKYTSLYTLNRKEDKSARKQAIFRLNLALLIFASVMTALLYLLTYVDESKYTTTAKVFTVTEDGTQFVDGAGYIWEVSDTDYKENTFVEITFDNNGTDYNRLDDIITNVRPQKQLTKRTSVCIILTGKFSTNTGG